MKQSRSLRQALPDYIPEAAVDKVADWFDANKVMLKISRDRHTKLGDFKSPHNGKPPSISVNFNLNKYSFLVTLLHEMAHATVFNNYKKRVAPHGAEWKCAFRELALPFLHSEVFPDEISAVFLNYLRNPAASSTSYLPLANTLRNYDVSTAGTVTVSMISPETLFSFRKGKVFRMLGKVRKRYRCFCLNDKKTYLFSPLATITPIADSKTVPSH